MGTNRLRMTGPVRQVMDLLIACVAADEPAWGLRVCDRTGLGPGTVYPILERLERAGWVASAMEPGQPSARPPRRLYTVTGTGRAEYQAALAARAARPRRWVAAAEFILHRPSRRPA